MQGKEPSLSQTHAEGNQCSVLDDDSNSFYMKLTELLDSSGLGLIFNVRETLLDLYLVYLEVTRRGGYHQVGREKKWGEVVSALKLEGNSVKLAAQLEKLYAHLLYQFEQLYFYHGPATQAAASSTTGSLKRKLNSPASISQLMDTKDDHMVTNMCKDYSSQIKEEQVLLPGSKERKKRRGPPLGHRNAYQIFLKQECARLRSCSQAPDGTRILNMARDAWKKMSEIEKQPYVEESRKNKEKSKEVMIGDNKQNSYSMQNAWAEKMPSLCGGDYYVTSQPEADNYLVTKATTGVALKMTEKAPKDSLFLIDWDPYLSLGLPTEKPK